MDRAALFHRFDRVGFGPAGADYHPGQQAALTIQRRLGSANGYPLGRRGLAGLEFDHTIDFTEVAAASSVSDRMTCSIPRHGFLQLLRHIHDWRAIDASLGQGVTSVFAREQMSGRINEKAGEIR